MAFVEWPALGERWFHWTPEEFAESINPDNCAFLVLERQPPPRVPHTLSLNSSYYRLTQDSCALLGVPYSTRSMSSESTWCRADEEVDALDSHEHHA
jgi:hypothetical protein